MKGKKERAGKKGDYDDDDDGESKTGRKERDGEQKKRDL